MYVMVMWEGDWCMKEWTNSTLQHLIYSLTLPLTLLNSYLLHPLNSTLLIFLLIFQDIVLTHPCMMGP